jgi:hypothetical protein
MTAEATGILVTVGQALDALLAMQKILTSCTFEKSIDTYLLARVVARLRMNPEIVATENTRASIVQKYTKIDPSTGSWQIPPDKMQEYAQDYGCFALASVELDVPKLPVSILKEVQGGVISGNEMLQLLPFLKEEDDV